MTTLEESIYGCLVGTAVGDALGLPGEGLSSGRQKRLFGQITGHRLVWGYGMVSDDTEHTWMTAQALIGSAGDPLLFARTLAGQLRRWIVLLPAGAGKATAISCVRLLFGVSPERSGIYSAGNGPAMRAALLGVCFSGDYPRLASLVRVSARLTHTDPKAEYGALAVAAAAGLSAGGELSASRLKSVMEDLLPPDAAATELSGLLEKVFESIRRGGEATTDFAVSNGMKDRVSGYMYHTVPIALHAACSYPRDYRAAVLSVIACGGDTDTTAAIVGGIVGAGVGAEGIPSPWRDRLAGWPCSAAWQRCLALRLARTLETGTAARPLPLFAGAVLLRNLLFLSVVLYHGLRRILPPY